MKKTLGRIAIIVVVVAVAVAAYMRFKPTKVSAAASVSTGTVQVGSLSATVNAAGNIQSHQTADLSFGQSGAVKDINVNVGDRVKAGDVLAELDTAELKLSLRNAEVS